MNNSSRYDIPSHCESDSHVYSVARSRRLLLFKGRCFDRNAFGMKAHSINFMIDSGATDSFVSTRTLSDLGIVPEDAHPKDHVTVKLADGTGYVCNKQIKRRINIGKYSISWRFMVLPLDGYDALLGLDWLTFHNPVIDWLKRTVRFEFQSRKYTLTSLTAPDNAVNVATDIYDDSSDMGIMSAASFCNLLRAEKCSQVFITDVQKLRDNAPSSK